jgi:hypothetical protein
MNLPGTPLRHAGGNYLLVEGGYNHDTRAITLLAEPDNEDFEHPEKANRVVWCDQGEWFPIAQWAVGMVTFQEGAYEEQRPLVDELFERFREEQQELMPSCWAVQGVGGLLGTLENILPTGLACKVFSEEEEAAKVAGSDELVPITNLPNFLTFLAREGYAGAMWNERMPIFFCIDGIGDLQFLRVRRTAAGKMGMDILEWNGDWTPYEGAEEIEFLENREACDDRLVHTVGNKPVVGWPRDGHLWGVGPRTGTPGRIASEEEEVVYGALFTEEGVAREWIEEVQPTWKVFPVDSAMAFLAHDELQGCGGLLNPGSHRVNSGVLWGDDEKVVLDSYSGFWSLDDGEFQPVE